ncbi:peptide-binding protein [Rhodococcus sp. Leaf7]|uniref:ABC transporter substrate-binding protein n=1 Tax=unclassified Rhodococcus (in: high G+C Gram-positive bacteria) TaxID=192944 RepID=UPI0006F998A8|nr:MULTISPECIES: ABC transporter substrate-binding protein [unclassified Rhodococcus (in: high G+C Gram-positive bacteria)]KQU02945.1 peptide-binding protein [Rhodococcus sp. Leaf7]KQU38744.1 peptide-binding protein [Rhodococcus sp. Leaf247]
MGGSTLSRTGIAAVALAAVVGSTLVACSSEDTRIPSIGYAVDNTISTYNAGTTEGSSSGAVQAFARVLPGFSVTAPSGGAVSDTDIGTAVEVPGEQQVITYTIAAPAVWSDGVPMTCDDMVLAWAARSGRTDVAGAPVFDAASTAGYADIERIDCAPADKVATVTFRSGRSYVDWRSLFGAGSMMPAHVAARIAGVPDIVGTLAGGDQEALGRVGAAWNTAWTLTPAPSGEPGTLDPAVFVSAGPFRVDAYSVDDGLVLVPNEKWWGIPAGTDRIVVWPKGADIAAKAASGDIEVVDADGGTATPDGFTATSQPSFGIEQLVMATSGVFADPAARRAFAACVPRGDLFAQHGHPGYEQATGRGSSIVDSRTTLPSTLAYRTVAGTAAERYRAPDVAGVTAGLAEAGLTDPVVRIGYLGPDTRRAAVVAQIAAACAPMGIDVVDSASATFTPAALRAGQVDVVLASTAGQAGATGTSSADPARFALRGGQGVNVGGYANPRIDQLVDQLAVDQSDATVLSAAVEAENILWTDMPSLPLYNAPRVTAVASGMRGVESNPTVAGAGWNMDKWILVG